MSSIISSAPAVSGDDTPPHVVEDCLGLLQMLSNGTIKRAPAALVLPGAPLGNTSPVQWKDVVYGKIHNLRLRMYVPSDGAKKLPVVIYFHGGGFCVGSFGMPNVHDACLRLATELPAILLSADYRLAPVHRLPAALDDIYALFSWLRGQAAVADAWLAESADFGRVFVSGDSAGANIAHHVGSGKLAAEPVRIAGYVLLWPYFGGENRTASEATCPSDVFLTLALYDQCYTLDSCSW